MAEFKTGFRWWDGMNDYRAFMDLKQRGSLTWSQWLKSVVGVECNGYFAWDDLRPVLQRTGYGLGAVKMVYDLQKLGVSDMFRV
jgi:hypothetical protein